jgi:hypothetical protein
MTRSLGVNGSVNWDGEIHTGIDGSPVPEHADLAEISSAIGATHVHVIHGTCR